MTVKHLEKTICNEAICPQEYGNFSFLSTEGSARCDRDITIENITLIVEASLASQAIRL
ncbi:MAG: hypothetical protein HC941_10735 [Microcoleus sp. SU_5_3]|nr:hypothetical protein [Microcoleus sp. SU_5_3]